MAYRVIYLGTYFHVHFSRKSAYCYIVPSILLFVYRFTNCIVLLYCSKCSGVFMYVLCFLVDLVYSCSIHYWKWGIEISNIIIEVLFLILISYFHILFYSFILCMDIYTVISYWWIDLLSLYNILSCLL